MLILQFSNFQIFLQEKESEKKRETLFTFKPNSADFLSFRRDFANL